MVLSLYKKIDGWDRGYSGGDGSGHKKGPLLAVRFSVLPKRGRSLPRGDRKCVEWNR